MHEKNGYLNRRSAGAILVMLLASQAGCVLVPQTRLDESQRIAQVLRTENARLKDQVLVLRGENRDASDRAVDDAKQLAASQEAIERLESSVRAYQDDRERLASSLQQIKSNLDLTSYGPRTRAAVRKSAKPDPSKDAENVDEPDVQRTGKFGDTETER